MARASAARKRSPARRLPGPERRSRILDAALPLFARRGYRGVSTSELASAVGVTVPVLYRHFASKQALFLAVLKEQALLLAEAIGDAADPTSAPLEPRVVKTARAVVGFVRQRPDAWRLLRRTPPSDPTIAKVHAELQQAARAVTAQTTARDRHFQAPRGIDRAAAAAFFGDLQWTAYEALGDHAAAHPELDEADLLSIFMDFVWVGLERHHRGKHWASPPRDDVSAPAAASSRRA
jgi:AcrR family transcriptional regulator